MTRPILSLAACLALGASGCTAPQSPSPSPAGGDAAGTRPAGEPALARYQGRVADGVECPTLETPDGRTFALSGLPDGYGAGDYVAIDAEMADASFCMQGEGTLIIDSIERADPPARDRDPARSGGLAVTSDYVRGSWVAKGLEADCAKPDFQVTANSNGLSIIETRVNGYPETGVVDVGMTPELQWSDPLPSLPIETRGPDGLAVMMPDNGEVVTLAGHPIEGDGVVFVKCA